MTRRPAALTAFVMVAGLASSARAQSAEPYAAALHAAFGRAEPGGYEGGPSGAGSLGLTFASVGVGIETHHLAMGRGWDFSLMFDGGWQPLFVMVKAPGSTAGTVGTPVNSVVPSYLSGLNTSTGLRFSHASGAIEMAAAGHVGATRLDSSSVADNDVAEWAFFADGSADLRWYGQDVSLLHSRNQTLDPIVHAYAGIRHDERFHRAGDLDGFNDPTGRLFFGFDVHPIRLVSRSGGSTLLSFGGGFDFEGALRTTERLPAGFKVGLSGRINLAGAFRR